MPLKPLSSILTLAKFFFSHKLMTEFIVCNRNWHTQWKKAEIHEWNFYVYEIGTKCQTIFSERFIKWKWFFSVTHIHTYNVPCCQHVHKFTSNGKLILSSIFFFFSLFIQNSMERYKQILVMLPNAIFMRTKYSYFDLMHNSFQFFNRFSVVFFVCYDPGSKPP